LLLDSISQAQPAERLMNNQFIKGENDWMSGTLGDDVEMTRDVFLTTCVVAEMKDLEIIILLEITFTA